MIWHHNDSVQVELAAVFLQAALKDNVSGLGWQFPAVISGKVMKIGRLSF